MYKVKVSWPLSFAYFDGNHITGQTVIIKILYGPNAEHTTKEIKSQLDAHIGKYRNTILIDIKEPIYKDLTDLKAKTGINIRAFARDDKDVINYLGNQLIQDLIFKFHLDVLEVGIHLIHPTGGYDKAEFYPPCLEEINN